MRIYDVVIVGAGPAGVGAALQCSINGLKLLLIEKNEIGGRIRLARRVENLLLDKAISGDDASGYLKKIVLNRGIDFIEGEVKKISSFEGRYITYTKKMAYYSKSVIVATGFVPNIPEIAGIDELYRKGRISFEWKGLKREVDSPVLVIGGGEVGCDSACSLKENGFDVIVFSRSEKLNINPILLQDVNRLGIKVINGIRYEEVFAQGNVIILNIIKNRKRYFFRGKSILITVGGRPNLSIIEGISERERLFVCGDANKDNYHQASIAFGDGINTGMRVTQILSGRPK